MLYSVGIYVRLSKEDSFEGCSMSVENQKAMLFKFVSLMPDWTYEKTYVDDGFSGGSFNRPAFLEMISDAQKGRINLVLVKDLSRFGRNYLEAGRYLQTVLPDAGCRFVSMSEGIDTAAGETDIIDFINFMNDFYLKNLSLKIKSVLTAKAKKGEFLMGREPYGYKRSDNDNHKLVIDKPAAEVVRKIFELRLMNMGYSKIAGVLNREHIPPPRVYAHIRKAKEIPYESINLWRDKTIRKILTNEVYIGHMVQQKCGAISHRDGRLKKKEACNWIRVENTHEPIISLDVWNRTHSAVLKKSALPTAHSHKEILFTGLLRCSGCNGPMIPMIDKNISKNESVVEYRFYVCCNHMTTGRAKCSRHAIYEMSLKRIVLCDVARQAGDITQNKTRIADTLRKKLSFFYKNKLSEMKSDMKRLDRKIRTLDEMMPKLYEDKINGVISSAEFNALAEKNESEKAQLSKCVQSLISAHDEIQGSIDDVQKWVNDISEKSISALVNKGFLTDIIERIEIGERYEMGGMNRREVKIYYKLAGSRPTESRHKQNS